MSDRPDDDPTGIRQILSSLKDPGPMPPELVHRISASLAQEQARRQHRVPESQPPPRQADVTDTWVHEVDPPTHRQPRIGSLSPLPTPHLQERPPRRSLAGRLPVLALAASVVVLAGAAVLGVFGRGWLPTGSDSGDISVASSEQRDSDAAEGGLAADSGGGAEEESATMEAFGDDSAAGTGPGADDGADAAAPEALTAPAPVLQSSGVLVTETTLRDTLVELRARAPLGHDDQARLALEGSSVATAEDAAACLGDLIDEPTAHLTPRVDVVDAVRFEGLLRALIVLTDGPAVLATPDEPASAYLVPLDCSPGSAQLLLDPVHVP